VERFLISLEADAQWEAVRAALSSAGFTDVTPPAPELPSVAVARLDPRGDVATAVSRVAGTPGVRHVEPDVTREAL
jgi:hypothetical protein